MSNPQSVALVTGVSSGVGRATAAALAARGHRVFGTSRNPAGVFIHALANTTKIPEAAPDTATSTPASQCTRGGTRSQPYK